MPASRGSEAGVDKAGLVAAVINFNTADLTERCVGSLLDAGLFRILVLDNGSAAEDFARVDAALAAHAPRVRLVRSQDNLGFAEGSNRLIAEALGDAACREVLLLNSDAVVDREGLDACLRGMRESGCDLMGGRMLKPGTSGQRPDDIDSLGIALYKSLLASNRKSTTDAYLGPTGGFAIYSRKFLEAMTCVHGYVFDPTYFCYAEDTDLCLRARLMGFAVGYTDRVVAYHEGQGSNAGQYNDFILYHGIRNSIWMVAKCMPFWILVAHLPWVLALHAGIIARHLRQGRWRTLARLYRDAMAGLPSILARRRVVQASRRVPLRALRACIDAKFYESRFLSGAVRELFRFSRSG